MVDSRALSLTAGSRPPYKTFEFQAAQARGTWPHKKATVALNDLQRLWGCGSEGHGCLGLKASSDRTLGPKSP